MGGRGETDVSLLGAMVMVCGVVWWGAAMLAGCVACKRLLREILKDL